MLAKKEFFFRPSDITAQQEFLSYPRGKNDDILDAIWMALDRAVPCRVKTVGPKQNRTVTKKVLDWMTM